MSRKRVERCIPYDQARQCYYVTLDSGKDREGVRRRRWVTCPNLAQARRILRDFEAERSAGAEVMPSELTLGQWLERWMEEFVVPNLAFTTVYGYRGMIEKDIRPMLGEVPLQKLTPADIQRCYAHLREDRGLAPYTVRHYHDLLSSALSLAVKQELLLRSPMERVEPPHVPPREAKFYRAEDLAALYRAAEGTWLETVVKLAGSLGLRREEICGLRWNNVDFKCRRIRICEARAAAGAKVEQKETKNRSSTRTLYMTDEILKVFQWEQERQRKLYASLKEEPCGFVTVDARGQPQSPNAVTLSFKRFLTANCLPPITLHGLRHTFATLASAQGAPLFEIGKAMGHSTPSTTGKIYTHLQDQTHGATLAKVEEALRGRGESGA